MDSEAPGYSFSPRERGYRASVINDFPVREQLASSLLPLLIVEWALEHLVFAVLRELEQPYGAGVLRERLNGR
jgi:hypothetical protein